MTLDVVAVDETGRGVPDLRREDFQLIQQGRVQSISNFQFVSVTPVRRDMPDPAVGPQLPDVVTNVRPVEGRQFVVVVDDLHILETHIVPTRELLLQFLRSVSPDDQVAIVYVGRSDLSVDFTTDSALQMRAVARLRETLGFAYDAAPMAPRYQQEEGLRRQFELRTLDVLKNVCSSLAGVGQSWRSVVYVGEGFADPDMFKRPGASDTYQQLLQTLDDARRAGVRIYTINPRGAAHVEDALRSPFEIQQPRAPAVPGQPLPPPDQRQPCGGEHACGTLLQIHENMQFQDDFMRLVANHTGGLAEVNRANLDAAVADIVRDNSSYYLIGFHPDPPVRDGKFHEVDVRVPGRPGLSIRAKAGYVAPSPVIDAPESRSPLNGVLGAALPDAAVPLRALAAPLTIVDAHTSRALVTMRVTYPVPIDGSHSLSDQFEFGIVAIDPDGNIRARTERAFHATATVPPGATDASFILNAPIDVPPGDLTLRIAIVSTALGRSGAIHLPVAAPDPGDRGLQIPALVLGSVEGAGPAVISPYEFTVPFTWQPTTRREFGPAETLRLYAPLWWRGSESHVDATLEIEHDGVVVRHEEHHLEAVDAHGTREAALDVVLPLTDSGSWRLPCSRSG